MNGAASTAAPYALTVKVVVNGSVTPKVISFSCPLGKGLWAISSSSWFCQKQSARATAKTTRQTTRRWRSSSRCSTRLSWSSWETARTRRGIPPASAVFVVDHLGLGRLDRDGGRLLLDRSGGRLRRADRLHVVVIVVVVVLVLAGDRLFELANPFAEAVSQLRQAFGTEHDQSDDEDDDDLEGADVSKHSVNGNGTGGPGGISCSAGRHRRRPARAAGAVRRRSPSSPAPACRR